MTTKREIAATLRNLEIAAVWLDLAAREIASSTDIQQNLRMHFAALRTLREQLEREAETAEARATGDQFAAAAARGRAARRDEAPVNEAEMAKARAGRRKP